MTAELGKGKLATWTRRNGRRVNVHYSHKDGRSEPFRFWYFVDGRERDVRSIPGFLDRYGSEGWTALPPRDGLLRFLRDAIKAGVI